MEHRTAESVSKNVIFVWNTDIADPTLIGQHIYVSDIVDDDDRNIRIIELSFTKPGVHDLGAPGSATDDNGDTLFGPFGVDYGIMYDLTQTGGPLYEAEEPPELITAPVNTASPFNFCPTGMQGMDDENLIGMDGDDIIGMEDS